MEVVWRGRSSRREEFGIGRICSGGSFNGCLGWWRLRREEFGGGGGRRLRESSLVGGGLSCQVKTKP